MGLQKYRAKRDFSRTPEPAGQARRGAAPRRGRKSAGELRFVIQKHAARRLHYDFRLEMEGVLRSWAVPKGPSLDPGEKRLAVQVEDHPVEYGGFEGIIPSGEYGGGTVILWDRGTWRSLEGDAVEAWRAGKIKFELAGEKLHGGWTLVRMHGQSGGEHGENWLLIKENDEAAAPGSGDEVVRDEVKSVESDLTIEQVAADPPRVWRSNRDEPAAGVKRGKLAAAKAARPAAPKAVESAVQEKPVKPAAGKAVKPAAGKAAKPAAEKPPAARRESPAKARQRLAAAVRGLPRAKRAALPRQVEPELATLASEPPAGERWLHEIKLDGYRLLCEVQRGKVRLSTRRGNDWTARFGPVAAAAAALPVESALLDGEVTVLLPNGKSSFQALQESLGDLPPAGGRSGRPHVTGAGFDAARAAGPLVYFAFDLLHLDGYDLRAAPLAARKELLHALLAAADGGADSGILRWNDHVEGQGGEFFRQACAHGLEGIVSKRADLPYRSGRSRDWLKVKCIQRQEMVIGGFTDPAGARTGLGALLVGVYDDGRLLYSGKVGTGFTEERLHELRRLLDPLERRTPAFANPPRGAEARGCHWVEPRLVAEVAFSEWTRDGVLRQPSFQGLREDKDPREVRREMPEAPPAGDDAPPTAAGAPGAKAAAPAARAVIAGGPGGAPAAAKKVSRAGQESEVAGVRLTHPDKVLFPGEGITKRDLAQYYVRIADWMLPQIAGRPLTLVRCPDGQGGECFYQKHLTGQFPESVHRVAVEEGGKKVPYGMVDSIAGIVALVQMGVLEIHVWGCHTDLLERPDYAVFDLDPDPAVPWERVTEAAREMRDLLAATGLRTFLKTTGGKGLHVVLPLQRRHTWDEVKGFTKTVVDAMAAAQPDRYTANPLKAHRKGRIYLDYLRNGRGATSISAYSCRSRPGAPVSAPLAWDEIEPGTKVHADTFTVANLPARLDRLRADPWADLLSVKQSLTADIKRRWGAGG